MLTLGGVWGHAPPEKLGALRSLLRPYLYPNATSPTRVHGGSDTAVCHDTCQSSWGISVTIVDLVSVGTACRRIDNLDKNSFYFGRSQRSPRLTAWRGGTMWQYLFKSPPPPPPPPPPILFGHLCIACGAWSSEKSKRKTIRSCFQSSLIHFMQCFQSIPLWHFMQLLRHIIYKCMNWE